MGNFFKKLKIYNIKNKLESILFKLTQRHQFCTEISSPIDDNTNSSSQISSMAEISISIEQNEQSEIFNGANTTSPISSPETPTNIAKEQNEQHQHEIPKIIFDIDKIHSTYESMVEFNRKMFKLILQKDKNGQKFFKIMV